MPRLCNRRAAKLKFLYANVIFASGRICECKENEKLRSAIFTCNMAARADFLFIAFHANVDIFKLSTIISRALRNNGWRDAFNSQLLTRCIYSRGDIKNAEISSKFQRN